MRSRISSFFVSRLASVCLTFIAIYLPGACWKIKLPNEAKCNLRNAVCRERYRNVKTETSKRRSRGRKEARVEARNYRGRDCRSWNVGAGVRSNWNLLLHSSSHLGGKTALPTSSRVLDTPWRQPSSLFPPPGGGERLSNSSATNINEHSDPLVLSILSRENKRFKNARRPLLQGTRNTISLRGARRGRMSLWTSFDF